MPLYPADDFRAILFLRTKIHFLADYCRIFALSAGCRARGTSRPEMRRDARGEPLPGCRRSFIRIVYQFVYQSLGHAGPPPRIDNLLITLRLLETCLCFSPLPDTLDSSKAVSCPQRPPGTMQGSPAGCRGHGPAASVNGRPKGLKTTGNRQMLNDGGGHHALQL